MASAGFYVYEHLRADTGEVFYVGKGSGHRARCRQGRNPYWRAVANKHGYVTRIVMSADDEDLAFLAEMELIDKHRRMGVRLTNLTDGGEGMSGFKMPPDAIERRAAKQKGQKRPSVSALLSGVPKSAEHRRKLSESRRGVRASDAAKAALSRASKGRPSSMRGKKHSEEAKAKISAAISGENNPFFGKTHTAEAIEKIRAANIGRKESDETRRRKSEAHKGEKSSSWGRKIPDEQKARQIASLKARPRVTCQYCGKTMDEANAKRWHIENCRERK